MALRLGDSVHTAAAGIINAHTGVEVTPDTVFQIGSIGKVFTATLVMQLVDDHLVDIERPVRTYLPEFTVGDVDASQRITVRNLLMHTSGMDGDFLPPDDPWGASSQAYLQKISLLPQLHPVGAYMTYCNSGYVVAGRIAEVLRRKPWAELVMERICRPLGIKNAYAMPTEGIRFRSAIGHLPDPKAPRRFILAPVSYLPQSIAAAGSALCMSADELLKFSTMHFSGGLQGGQAIISHGSAMAMQEQVVALPEFSRSGYTHMGLGWLIGRHSDRLLFGHDGSTCGQYSYMQCMPDRGISFALLTNSPSTSLINELKPLIHGSIAGLPALNDPEPNPVHFDCDRFIGVYENAATRIRVTAVGSDLHFETESRGSGTARQRGRLLPHSENCFQLEADDPALRGKITFLGDRNGRPEYFRLGLRMARRIVS